MLNHFRKLSNDLEAARLGYLNQSKFLREQIEATSSTITRLESEKQDATKHREALRQLKKQRADLKAPSVVDPFPDVERYAAAHSKDSVVEPIEIKIPNGQTPLAVHNNFTEKTNDILAQIQRLHSIPNTDVDIAAKVDALASPPRIVGGQIVWPKHVVDSNGVAITVVNTEGILAWLHRDELIAGLELTQPTDKQGMSSADKAKELATLYGHFTKAMRYESAAATEAEKAGQRVIRRRHIHPAILLGLVVSPVAAFDWFSKKRGT